MKSNAIFCLQKNTFTVELWECLKIIKMRLLSSLEYRKEREFDDKFYTEASNVFGIFISYAGWLDIQLLILGLPVLLCLPEIFYKKF